MYNFASGLPDSYVLRIFRPERSERGRSECKAREERELSQVTTFTTTPKKKYLPLEVHQETAGALVAHEIHIRLVAYGHDLVDGRPGRRCCAFQVDRLNALGGLTVPDLRDR